MARFLIVGKSFSGVTNRLKAMGHDYIILKDHAVGAPATLQSKRRLDCDFSTKQTVLATVDGIAEEVNAVLAIYENYVLPAAWISEHLHLPGLPVEAALACTDKWAMRQAFAAAPVLLNPEFSIVKSEADLEVFAAAHGFPLMLKPANLVKSLLVTKSDSLPELLANYRQMTAMIHDTYATYAKNREPLIIVETFLQGSMHTVAGFADSGGEPHLVDSVVDLQLAREAGFKDTFLYNRLLPSRLSASDQEKLLETAKIGMRTLGMKNSPAHVELILTPDGPRIVEIGARNGGYRERMYMLANGIDLAAAALDIALDKKPSLTNTKHDPCAVLELFPRQPGTFIGIDHADEVRALTSCIYFGVKTQPGSFVGRAADGFKRCAIIILHNTDEAQFRADLAFVEQSAQVITKLPEGNTL